ncbi:3'-5' exonuclease [Candidatus Poriferisodalis sp.]|uniref:3'-5' exonuclease n=1 Tax=Candidatus Poriferisodalis sp. TaxID=3101277 RepID=UPI003B51EB0A
MPNAPSHVAPGLRVAPGFRDSLAKLTKDEQFRVYDAMARFAENPGLPGLNFEKLHVKGPRVPLWSIRASDELRIVLHRDGRECQLLHAGHHDEAYKKAKLLQSGAPQSEQAPEEPADQAETDVPPSTERHAKPNPYVQEIQESRPTQDEPQRPLLWMWTAADVLDVFKVRDGFGGLTADQAAALVRATDADGDEVLLRHWPGDDNAELRRSLLELLFELHEIHPDRWRSDQLTAAEQAAVEQFALDITERGAASALSITLNADEVKRLAEAPVEDWMIFLHPAQQEIVERHFNGPARVSGSAGTGKTSVALHRAAWLAKHPPDAEIFDDGPLPILFTTFIRSLPPVLESLYSRLPTAVEGTVEFTNIDELAKGLCQEIDEHRGGPQANVNIAQSKSTFARAKRDVVRPGSPLHALGLSDDYLIDEVTKVIIGRDIGDLETYRKIRRHGREVAFQHPVREQMWDLHIAWREMMEDRGLEHFDDRIRRARDYVRSLPQPQYRAVLVDESQDLTQIGLELLSALVAERVPSETGDGHGLVLGQNSLLIVGDAAQRVYPGGFALSDAGVEVRGRSETLDFNYRNTRQIIEAAMACTGAQEIADLSEETDDESAMSPRTRRRADAHRETHRNDGVPPRLVIVADQGEERRYVVNEITQLTSTNPALGLGDFGVFAATNKQADAAISALEQADLRCINLRDFVGKATDEVRVGTFDRAKGLEFKVVFLLGVSHGAWPFTAPNRLPPAERVDAEALATTKLFVAMTRARDALYVVCSEKPHSLINAGREHFETIRYPAA